MWANRILIPLANLAALVTLPLVWVSTFVLGIVASLTFGLILLPLSLIWAIVFMGPLLGLSWLWDRAPLLRILLAIIGIPLALLGSVFVALIPSMGEMESRQQKLNLCWAWPFSLDLMKLQSRQYLSPERERRAWEVLDRVEPRFRPSAASQEKSQEQLEAELAQARAELASAERNLYDTIESFRPDPNAPERRS